MNRLPESEKKRLITSAWNTYQFGQGSCDHTDREVFEQAMDLLVYGVENFFVDQVMQIIEEVKDEG